MAGTHTHAHDHGNGGSAQELTILEQMRKINAQDPDVPNRTKVVRLIVWPDKVDWRDPKAARDYAMSRHATRGDIFVVHRPNPKTGVLEWAPMSWLGQALVEHDDGHARHRETVPILMIQDREQLQWECDVPFRISNIVHIASHHSFQSIGQGTEQPFRKSLVLQEVGGPGKPIISGPPEMQVYRHNRLFKLSFDLELHGSGGWTTIDPDLHCDWQ